MEERFLRHSREVVLHLHHLQRPLLDRYLGAFVGNGVNGQLARACLGKTPAMTSEIRNRKRLARRNINGDVVCERQLVRPAGGKGGKTSCQCKQLYRQ